MALRLVTYKPVNETNKKVIRNEIKAYKDWREIGESVYAVVTNDSPKRIYSHLKKFIDENDKLYIINLTQPAAGTGPDKTNDWLRDNLPSGR